MNGNIAPIELLKEGMLQLGVPDSQSVPEKLIKYMDMVLETNKVMNLTAITEPDEFIIKHFLDSFSICRNQAFIDAETIIDVGTGAGFPGLPLAIAFPEKQFSLMDSLNKRILFINRVIEELDLKNVTCYHSRAEELGNSNKHREIYDLCVSRAVAKLAVLSEYCIPFVKVGGSFVSYKAQGEDLAEGNNAIRILGAKLEAVENFPALTGTLESVKLDHRLVYIKKIKHTPGNYPRKAGMPSKNPL